MPVADRPVDGHQAGADQAGRFRDGRLVLSTGIGNNLSGIFASHVSGTEGMSVASALSGYTFGFWALVIPGVLLFVIAPLIQRLMHGVK